MHGSGTRIRTLINRSRGDCPTVERHRNKMDGGFHERSAVDDLHTPSSGPFRRLPCYCGPECIIHHIASLSVFPTLLFLAGNRKAFREIDWSPQKDLHPHYNLRRVACCLLHYAEKWSPWQDLHLQQHASETCASALGYTGNWHQRMDSHHHRSA